jgi:hypothetical protein
MLLVLYRFIADWTDSLNQRRITWMLAAVGTGFGWLALPFGYITSDLLVLPEAFPLQAVYANAHFPWAIAIAIALAHLLTEAALTDPPSYPELNARTLAIISGTLLLVSMSPFVLVPLGIGYAALCAWLGWKERRFPRRELLWGGIVVIFGLPLALYNAWAISGVNPIFQRWMQQNVTPSPPVWDYLIAFGPLLILAAIGLWALRKHLDAGDAFLIGWIASTFICLYLPLGLQRRFAMGLIVPLAIYAGTGLWRVIAPRVPDRWRVALAALVFLAFAPTTVLTILLPLYGTLSPEQGFFYYVTSGEYEALEWIGERAAPHDVVLASPEFSLFVPTVGPRVVYGHPFETLDAARREAETIDYFAGASCEAITAEGVDYVIVGPRERALSRQGDACEPPGEPAFTSSDGEVLIYAARGQ